jgi:hypothetical protein
VRGQQFQDYLSVQIGVGCQIHFPHPAYADSLSDPIVIDHRARRQDVVGAGIIAMV